jgi:hypothetical protein
MNSGLRSYLHKLAQTICTFLICFCLPAGGIALYQVFDNIQTDWQPAEVELTGFEPHDRTGRAYRACVHFVFQVDGVMHKSRICGEGVGKRDRTREGAIENAKRGTADLHQIWYDPSDPSRTRLNESTLPLSVTIFIAAAGGVFLGIAGHRKLFRRRQVGKIDNNNAT